MGKPHGARRSALAAGLAACMMVPACGRLNFDPVSASDAGTIDDDAAPIDAGVADADLRGSWQEQSYFKASNSEADDEFGRALALSGDGSTLAVSAYAEASSATGVGGNQDNNIATAAGAVYIYRRDGLQWSQVAYIKASNTDADDRFGTALALSADGRTLAVGAPLEDSGLPSDPTNNVATDSGAVYVFGSVGDSWEQQAYVKASNLEARDLFGSSVALSSNGTTLAVGATLEDSAESGTAGNGGMNGKDASGAVYIFELGEGPTWLEKAYLKASNSSIGARFGSAVSLSETGDVLAVASDTESSNATGIDGDDGNTLAPNSGAVFVFGRVLNNWSQSAYLKASNTDADDRFGIAIDISANGKTIAVGASFEDSRASAIGGDEMDNSALASGAAYLFAVSDQGWQQTAYIKPFNADAGDQFGAAIALDGQGKQLAVSARFEDSASVMVNGDAEDNSASNAGCVYSFSDEGEGGLQRGNYIKASNAEANDLFGFDISINGAGDTLIVGATQEASAAKSVAGDAADNSAPGAGAAYSFEI